MRSLSMRKRVCALLVVLGAFGTMVGSVAPADAQTGPQGVKWGQRYRSVSFKTPLGACYDIRVDGATYTDVPYGQYREPFQAWFTCGNGTKTFAADLYTHAETGFDGWGWAEYRLEVRVDTAAGSTYCGRVTAWSWLNRYITGHETFQWSQAAATSANGAPGEGYRRLNCGSHGNIDVRVKVEEGRGTF
jgi:hypothetical protein